MNGVALVFGRPFVAMARHVLVAFVGWKMLRSSNTASSANAAVVVRLAIVPLVTADVKALLRFAATNV
ncbi:hypothetical protein [Sinorhizobium saheli]|uniref:Uncharacterized protein n=1 Tax=Sinorhizobium saheli TaxID=36856 RepID=A0A178YQY3_SINSA|nr:hypothetical protein [Sinorhizobium saheli]MQW88165.1 hypothetical protein [Sinorhizobium saheli]OAP49864.1 hypothetical protein ATB98_15160 [Sinorhizobium saheli]